LIAFRSGFGFSCVYTAMTYTSAIPWDPRPKDKGGHKCRCCHLTRSSNFASKLSSNMAGNPQHKWRFHGNINGDFPASHLWSPKGINMYQYVSICINMYQYVSICINIRQGWEKGGLMRLWNPPKSSIANLRYLAFVSAGKYISPFSQK